MVDCIESSVSNHSWAPKGEYPSFSLCICNSCSGDFQSSLLGSMPKLGPLTLCSCSQPFQFRQYQGLSKCTSSTSPSSGPSPIFFFHFVVVVVVVNNIVMWTTFKVFTEFITMLLLFYILAILATRHLWSQLPDQGADWNQIPHSGRRSRNHGTTREVPLLPFWLRAETVPVAYQSQLPILWSCPPILPEVTAPSCVPYFDSSPFLQLLPLTLQLCSGNSHLLKHWPLVV